MRRLLSVVIDDLDIGGAIRRPVKADPPLIIDPHGMLPGPIPLQLFQVIPRWKSQILQGNRRIQRREHRPRSPDQITGKPLAELAFHGIGCACPWYFGLSELCQYLIPFLMQRNPQ